MQGGQAARERTDELAWLAELLWGPTPEVDVVVGAVPDGCSPTASWGILPDRRHPPVLVPLASRRAAAEAVRQYSHGMTQRARLAKAAVGRGLRSGALQWWLRRRDLLVHVIGPPAGTLLGGHAAEALGRTDLQPRSCSARSGPTASRWCGCWGPWGGRSAT